MMNESPQVRQLMAFGKMVNRSGGPHLFPQQIPIQLESDDESDGEERERSGEARAAGAGAVEADPRAGVARQRDPAQAVLGRYQGYTQGASGAPQTYYFEHGRYTQAHPMEYNIGWDPLAPGVRHHQYNITEAGHARATAVKAGDLAGKQAFLRDLQAGKYQEAGEAQRLLELTEGRNIRREPDIFFHDSRGQLIRPARVADETDDAYVERVARGSEATDAEAAVRGGILKLKYSEGEITRGSVHAAEDARKRFMEAKKSGDAPGMEAAKVEFDRENAIIGGIRVRMEGGRGDGAGLPAPAPRPPKAGTPRPGRRRAGTPRPPAPASKTKKSGGILSTIRRLFR